MTELEADGRAALSRLPRGGKGNARGSGYARQRDDWYVEPAWVVDALLDAEEFIGGIFDPSCGAGNIPERCAARGIATGGSDIVYRGFGANADFFTDYSMRDNIVSNPPYSTLEKFVWHALDHSRGKVAVLARLAFLEGERRCAMFGSTPLARVLVSSRRVSMPPGDSSAKPVGGSVAFAWFVWEHGYIDEPVVRRQTRCRSAVA